MHEKYIEKIINSTDNSKMHELKDVLLDTIDYVKSIDKKTYNQIECDLYEIAEGKVLNEEMVRNIINNMKPYGMRFNFQESEEIRKQYGYNNISPCDFWVCINMYYNDCKDTADYFFNNDEKSKIEFYACLANDFICDKDAPEDKVYCYFTKIV